MSQFELHPQLRQDCQLLTRLELCHVLLMNNALVPWFILVPETQHTEFHHLSTQQQGRLVTELNQIAGFIEHTFDISKINTAAIGNIVRQMHIHIVGRHEQDFCWPGVVWGRPEKQPYAPAQIEHIKAELHQWLKQHRAPI